jgi:hypothetical protein
MADELGGYGGRGTDGGIGASGGAAVTAASGVAASPGASSLEKSFERMLIARYRDRNYQRIQR